MKRFMYIFTLVATTLAISLHAGSASPWNETSNKAFKLPSKDKDKLNNILRSAKALIIKNSPDITTDWFNNYTKSSVYTGAYDLFNKTAKELSEQIGRADMSLSGMLSSLTWRERLEQLKESILSIVIALDANKAYAQARSMATYVIATLNDLIADINRKSTK